MATTYVAAQPAGEDLAAQCRAAADDFRPLDRNDLLEVRAELVAAVERLGQRLEADGSNGADWKEYLQWGDLVAQLRDGCEPNVEALEEISKRYAAGHNGLRLAPFTDVHEALRHYCNTARNIDNPDLEPAFRQLLEVLAQRLESYARQPTAEDALVIGHALGQLDQARQVPELVAAIRRQLVHPNLYASVAARVIDLGFGGPLDETNAVRDYILGTSVYGTSHTLGVIRAGLVPCDQRATLDIRVEGTAHSDNVGYHGPLTIDSQGTSDVRARKRIYLDTEGFTSLPAATRINTQSRLTGIRHRRDSRLIEKIAWKRAWKQKPESEQIASQHAEQRTNVSIDEQAGGRIERIDEIYRRQIRQTLVVRNLFPQSLRFRTTEEALKVAGLRTAADQLGAPNGATKLIEPRDLALQIHESLIDNWAASALGGVLLREEKFQELLLDFLGMLPERFRSEPGQPPWAIDFAGQQPISVEFAGQVMRLTLRGQHYYKGEDRYPAMNITVAYQIVPTELGFKLVRQGNLEILPPEFDPQSGKRLSARQVVIRTLLERRFNRIFQEEFVAEGFKLSGNWERLGKVRPVQFSSEDGWLTIAWRCHPEPASGESSAATAQR